LAILATTAHARGVSPYLPTNLAPEIERKIERLLILADQPVLKRPIAAATVLDALPRACERDAALCAEVRRYINGFMRSAGIGHASLAVGAGTGTNTRLANRHGMTSDSDYEVSASIFWQPSDFILVSGGALAYESGTTPTGSLLSIGTEHLQVDIGYRDHWLSPLTDSAMLLSTQAETMPSVTVSNYAPISRLGFRYEAFVAEMSETGNIVVDGALTSGHPLLAGVALSIEPLPGWSIGVNRLLQFGGGGREESLGDLFRAFFDPSSDNIGTEDDPAEEFGNQAASLTSRFIVPGRTPVAVYFEYAGEDTSTTNNLRLGNVALAAGIELPSLWSDRLALTFEASEWQNAWYVHHIYGDGLVNSGSIIGHWGADWREAGDGIGARSFMVRLGVSRALGGDIEATFRTLDNENYDTRDYRSGHHLEVRYSRRWRELTLGAEAHTGRDWRGASFGRASVFARF
jgi:hypothetical protein